MQEITISISQEAIPIFNTLIENYYTGTLLAYLLWLQTILFQGENKNAYQELLILLNNGDSLEVIAPHLIEIAENLYEAQIKQNHYIAR